MVLPFHALDIRDCYAGSMFLLALRLPRTGAVAMDARCKC